MSFQELIGGAGEPDDFYSLAQLEGDQKPPFDPLYVEPPIETVLQYARGAFSEENPWIDISPDHYGKYYISGSGPYGTCTCPIRRWMASWKANGIRQPLSIICASALPGQACQDWIRTKRTCAGSLLDFSRCKAGPDGNLWFTEFEANQIGRIRPSGTITEFPVPTPRSGPTAITRGPDGNLWFTEAGRNQIGRIAPQGLLQLLGKREQENPVDLFSY